MTPTNKLLTRAAARGMLCFLGGMFMSIRLLACALALASTSAAAQIAAGQTANVTTTATVPVQSLSGQTAVEIPSATSSTGPLLWRNITSGMPIDRLHALYPQGLNVTYKNDRTVLSNVPIIEGCDAKVNVMHEAGAVKEIVMRGEGAIAGRCSLKIITALSGKYGEPLEKDKVKGSLFAREGKNYVWSRDGVTLQFKRYTNGPLGGGGLLAASWEMRYAANATSIDL
ncbi:hypothetical protein ACFQPG_03080 [Sphingomonas sp. GCM10030256]|uniref:hypothetical protein n=1 Tax=Sphingomonas sp. GCM10030256 TaxID=3273427 RepID=UPI003620CAC1